MNTQKLVTSNMKTKTGKLVRIKKSSLPKVKVGLIIIFYYSINMEDSISLQFFTEIKWPSRFGQTDESEKSGST